MSLRTKPRQVFSQYILGSLTPKREVKNRILTLRVEESKGKGLNKRVVEEDFKGIGVA